MALPSALVGPVECWAFSALAAAFSDDVRDRHVSLHKGRMVFQAELAWKLTVARGDQSRRPFGRPPGRMKMRLLTRLRGWRQIPRRIKRPLFPFGACKPECESGQDARI
jgi:hypothetical protein